MTTVTAAGGPDRLTHTEVAYIGGAGRSGSTLLALLLGQLPGVVAVGGVGNLWERGLAQNYLCGCGAHFRDCPFWTRVGEEAFGGWSSVDPDEVLALKSDVGRYRHWLWYRHPVLRPSFAERVSAYGGYMGRLYAAIRSVSGRRVVIDTSHEVMSALLLLHVPDVEPRILHLVRDSRAVAFSLSRRVVRREATEHETLMPRYSAVPASLQWMLANLPYHLEPIRTLPRLRVSYEGLTASPGAEIERIAEFLGLSSVPRGLTRMSRAAIALGDNHMISGNPHRLGRTSVRVRVDDEWRSAMPPRDRFLVTAITSPLAVAYGYVGGGRPRSHHRRRGLRAV